MSCLDLQSVFSLEDDSQRQCWYKSVPPGGVPASPPLPTMETTLRTGLLLALAVSALADNLALESQSYIAHSSCHTEYEHVTVVKQGQVGVLNVHVGDKTLP